MSKYDLAVLGFEEYFGAFSYEKDDFATKMLPPAGAVDVFIGCRHKLSKTSFQVGVIGRAEVLFQQRVFRRKAVKDEACVQECQRHLDVQLCKNDCPAACVEMCNTEQMKNLNKNAITPCDEHCQRSCKKHCVDICEDQCKGSFSFLQENAEFLTGENTIGGIEQAVPVRKVQYFIVLIIHWFMTHNLPAKND